MKLKGEMSMLNVLQLQNADIERLCKELKQKVEEAPQFFVQSPLVIDCSELDTEIFSIDFLSFKHTLLSIGFIPVGIRNAPEEMNKTLAESGWAIMRDSIRDNSKKAKPVAEDLPVVDGAKNDNNVSETNGYDKGNIKNSPSETVVAKAEDLDAVLDDNINESPNVNKEQASPKAQNGATNVAGLRASVTVDKTVRSGQQIYAAEADMTVLASTSSGSELMADGSIHIYGPLRGRVLAGARGNESARIYCQSLQAELFAIAGRYQLLDESDTHLKGKPVMIRLEGDKLVIEALN